MRVGTSYEIGDMLSYTEDHPHACGDKLHG